MKKILSLLLFLGFSASTVLAQRGNVNWRFSSKKIADKTFELRLSAFVDPGWHIYSQDNQEGICLPTTFSFNKNPLVELVGRVKEEGKLIKHKLEIGDDDEVLNYYEGQVDFVQIVKLKANAKTNISGKVDFMICTDAMCLPEDHRGFSFSLDPSK